MAPSSPNGSVVVGLLAIGAALVVRTIARVAGLNVAPASLTLTMLIVGVVVAVCVLLLLKQVSTPYVFEARSASGIKRVQADDAVRRQRLTKAKLADISSREWDAIVVGSGIGGLVCAATLSNEGKKVLVLEQHDVAGGCTHTFKDLGAEFDSGFHYVGGPAFGTNMSVLDGSNLLLNKVCSGAESPLEWTRMDDIYDFAVHDGKKFGMPSGKSNLIAKLIKEFPDEEEGIKLYFKLIADQCATSGLFFGAKVLASYLPTQIINVIGPLLSKPFRTLSSKTVDQVIGPIIEDQALKNLLTYCWGNYGLPPNEASWAIHAMVINHYMSGAAYPKGGASEVACRIIPTITKAGGNVFVCAKVNSILINKDNCACGVILEKQNMKLHAKAVVSGISLRTTIENLIPDQHKFLVADARKDLDDMTRAKPSTSHLQLFATLDGTASDLRIPAANLWIATDPDANRSTENYLKSDGEWDELFPAVFLSFPSTKDSEWNDRFPNRSTAHIVVPAEYSWFESWANTTIKRRGPGYEALKERLAQQLLEIMYEEFPHLRGKVVSYQLSSPLTNNHYLGVQLGESYGLASTPNRFKLDWLKPQSPVSGLFFTGQDIVSAGVMGAACGGLLTATAMSTTVLWSNLRVLAHL